MYELLLAASLGAAPLPAATPAFRQLQALAGDWEAKAGGGDGGAPQAVRIAYQLVANDSVLVETYTTPGGGRTMTVFHLDGDYLVATHYCAQRNQPRLRLASSSASSVAFEFWDATNLATAAAAHLRRLELTFADATHFVRREVYVENGKDAAAELTLARVAVPAPPVDGSFRLIEPDGAGSPAIVFEVARDGRLFEYTPGTPEADRAASVRLADDDSVRPVDGGRVLFQRRASDGALLAAGGPAEQDLHCRLTAGTVLRCLHDGGAPALTFSVRGGRIKQAGDLRPAWTVEPSPSTDEQRRRALLVFAMILVARDTESHDAR